MKPTCWMVIFVGMLVLPWTPLAGREEKPGIEVKKITPEDNEILEEWVRVTNDEDVLGVGATRSSRPKWNWRIFVNAAEFVRKEPLESRLHNGVMAALKKMKGVTAVAHEDREVWVVQAEASGEDLVRACSAAVDELAADIRKHLKSLEEAAARR